MVQSGTYRVQYYFMSKLKIVNSGSVGGNINLVPPTSTTYLKNQVLFFVNEIDSEKLGSGT